LTALLGRAPVFKVSFLITMKTTTNLLLTATVVLVAVSAHAAVIGEVRLVPELPVALNAATMAPTASVLSAPALSASAMSAPLAAASLPISRLPLPAVSLPAAPMPAPISGPARLPGVHNPLPLPQTIEVADASYLDWGFLDGPSAAPAMVRAPRGPKNLPPSGAAKQLKFAVAAAQKPLVTIGADPTFDAYRPRSLALVPAE
jgi:hypothetical protein